MTDIALRFDAATWSADLAIEGGDLATDDGLISAILVSLFTDARARPDDPLPAGADPRGWWGDGFADAADDSTGSRLWLLEREKLTEATRLRAHDIVSEALAWLLEDQVVSSLAVETVIMRSDARFPSGALGIGVTLTRPGGPARQRFDFAWDATNRSLA